MVIIIERHERSDVAAPSDTSLSLSPARPLSLARALSILQRQSDTIMDSNSNSFDFSPKIEVDSENEKDYSKREVKFNWTSENTMKLIETMERDCRELWDIKNPWNKDRTARQAKTEFLAEMFDTTSDEIGRKIHNLRTQFNNELRKIKRRQVTKSGWEYFDALSFLMRAPVADPLDSLEAVNLELAEFQAEEEEEFGAAARAHALALTNTSPNRTKLHKPPIRVAASAPPPLPPSAHPMMWPEEPVPKLRPGLGADECQIFGDFVASELRTLRSDESRKKLKRMIQKAILKVGEEEDVNIISG